MIQDWRFSPKKMLALGSLLALPFFAGCASGYHNQASAFIKPLQAGQFVEAGRAADDVVGSVKEEKAKVDGTDRLIFRMEQGAVLQAAGRPADSAAAFKQADDMIYLQDQKPDLKFSTEITTSVTNQTYRDYEPFTYDRLAIEIYQALNYMQLGDMQNARTALRQLQQRQVDAEEHFQKEIDALEGKNEKAKEKQDKTAAKAEPSQGNVDVKGVRSNPAFSSQVKNAYGDVPNVPDRSAYKNFTNPFGEYLQGIYFMSTALSGSDLETASTAFKRLRGMMPENEYVAQDLALAESVANGGKLAPTTYVLFETGLAPYRSEIRIDVPIIVARAGGYNPAVPYAGAAFPKLEYHKEPFAHYLNVAAGGTTYKSSLITDMDQVIKKDFNNELPLIIARTIVATVAKAAISYGLHEASRGNGYAQIGVDVASTLYQVAMNQADLRQWESLPKQYHIVRFPTPADRKITLSLPDMPAGVSVAPITLVPGEVNVVCVKSTSANQVPQVLQFKLK